MLAIRHETAIVENEHLPWAKIARRRTGACMRRIVFPASAV